MAFGSPFFIACLSGFINGYAAQVTVSLNQIIEFEDEDEKTEVEVENGMIEIDAPSMLPRVTATGASGNSSIVETQSEGLSGDNDDNGDD